MITNEFERLTQLSDLNNSSTGFLSSFSYDGSYNNYISQFYKTNNSNNNNNNNNNLNSKVKLERVNSTDDIFKMKQQTCMASAPFREIIPNFDQEFQFHISKPKQSLSIDLTAKIASKFTGTFCKEFYLFVLLIFNLEFFYSLSLSRYKLTKATTKQKRI